MTREALYSCVTGYFGSDGGRGRLWLSIFNNNVLCSSPHYMKNIPQVVRGYGGLGNTFLDCIERSSLLRLPNVCGDLVFLRTISSVGEVVCSRNVVCRLKIDCICCVLRAFLLAWLDEVHETDNYRSSVREAYSRFWPRWYKVSCKCSVMGEEKTW